MIEYLTNLIGEYKYVVTRYSQGILLPKVQQIKIDARLSNDVFEDILQTLISALGAPTHVHSFYGYLWQQDNKVITFSVIEESYNCEVMCLLLFKGIPLGKKISYPEYCQLNNIVKDFADKQSLQFDSFAHYHDNGFHYLLSNSNKQLLLKIKGSVITYSLSAIIREETITKLVPQKYAKKVINRKKFENINNAIIEIFDELEEIG